MLITARDMCMYISSYIPRGNHQMFLALTINNHLSSKILYDFFPRFENDICEYVYILRFPLSRGIFYNIFTIFLQYFAQYRYICRSSLSFLIIYWIYKYYFSINANLTFLSIIIWCIKYTWQWDWDISIKK